MNKIRFTTTSLLSCTAILLIFTTCIPVFMNLGIFRNAVQLLSMTLFILAICISRDKGLLTAFVFGGSIAILMVVFARTIYGYANDLFSVAFNVFADWAFITIGIYLLRKGREGLCKKMLFLIVIIYGIVAITTVVGLQKYPMATRELGRLGSYSDVTGAEFGILKQHYRTLNIASISQIYGMVFAIPSFLCAFVKSRKLVFAVCAIICELCVFKGQVTFALVLSLVMVALCVMKPSKKRRQVAIIAIVIFVALLVLMNIKPILIIMIGFTSGKNMTMLSDKLYDLYQLFGGSVEGDALSRITLYKRSLNIFCRHPIFGQSIWGIGSAEFSLHSEFLDFLGYYGLLGASIVIILAIRYFIFLGRSNRYKWASVVTFIGFLMLYVFNLIWLMPQVYLGVFVLPALVSCAYGSKSETCVMSARY